MAAETRSGSDNDVQVFFDESVRDHRGTVELTGGRFVPCFENPSRIDAVLDALRSAGHEMCEADPFDRDAVEAVHDPRMVDFLESAWTLWMVETGSEERDALPIAWPAVRMPWVEPRAMVGRLGHWCFDAGTPITKGTWASATASVGCALSALSAVQDAGNRLAFAACRPPGHHAGRDHFGGYCYLNSSAILAEAARDNGADRVVVLDVDDHHGNGTQDIFYRRSDVLTLSLHGDPDVSYPYFTGRVDEVGEGVGEGFNINYPLARGAGWSRFGEALRDAITKARAFDPDLVVVPLGVDTSADDPIGARIGLDADDFERVGRELATLDRPTVVVMEGGYGVESIGRDVAVVLAGLEGRGSPAH